MTPKQRVYALAAKIGADVEADTVERDLSINVLAPSGFHFRLNRTHALAETAPVGSGGWTAAAWSEMARRLEGESLEACTSGRDCDDNH